VRGLNLIDKFAIAIGNHFRLAACVLAQAEDVHIQRDVAVGHVQHKVGKVGFRSVVGEFEPLKPF
jgi:acyl-CoA hydrolase